MRPHLFGFSVSALVRVFKSLLSTFSSTLSALRLVFAVLGRLTLWPGHAGRDSVFCFVERITLYICLHIYMRLFGGLYWVRNVFSCSPFSGCVLSCVIAHARRRCDAAFRRRRGTP